MLVALDKGPGTRPVGIGEVYRRLMAKCLLNVAGHKATVACGTSNLCAGLPAGIEGALHAMGKAPDYKTVALAPDPDEGAEDDDPNAPTPDEPLLTQPPTEMDVGVEQTDPDMLDGEDPFLRLMLDARNGFNELGRKAMFWTVGHRWAAGARFAFNCYRHQSQLILRRKGLPCYTILSEEGVTQGDPLSMILYGTALCPLAERLQAAVPEVVQPWYADDAAMAGPASKVRKAMMLLQKWGPARGYFPEPAKSIVVCDKTQWERCKSFVGEFNFTYTEGHRYVGGFLGPDVARRDWLDPQIQKWVRSVKALAKVARRYPQTAYTGLAKSLQSEWMYLQRVTAGVEDAFAPIEKALVEDFLPALLGATREEVASLRPLLALSARCAGLGIPNPTETAGRSFDTSVESTTALVLSLLEGAPLDVVDYIASAKKRKRQNKLSKIARDFIALTGLMEDATAPVKRRVKRAEQSSNWITVMPNRLNGTELSSEVYRDSLRLRYGLRPANLPPKCDGCGANFTVGHAMSCKKGGNVLLRHNEVAHEWGMLCSHAYIPSAVSYEPLIKFSRDQWNVDAAGRPAPVDPESRGDISVRGFWKRGTTAVFDVRITDTDQPSYLSQTPAKVLAKHEKEKKDKYLEPCLAGRRQFTPLVFSVDGMPGAEALAAMKRLASSLATKWKREYSAVSGYVRSRLMLAVLRGSNLCLRGPRGDPRPPTHHVPWEGGSGLRLYQ